MFFVVVWSYIFYVECETLNHLPVGNRRDRLCLRASLERPPLSGVQLSVDSVALEASRSGLKPSSPHL